MKPNKLPLEELFALIKKKISAKEKNSYTYELAKAGLERTARKVGEEAVEVVVAAFLNDKKRSKKTRNELVGEVCDLFFHTLVLLASQGVELEEILSEFKKRNVKK